MADIQLEDLADDGELPLDQAKKVYGGANAPDSADTSGQPPVVPIQPVDPNAPLPGQGDGGPGGGGGGAGCQL